MNAHTSKIMRFINDEANGLQILFAKIQVFYVLIHSVSVSIDFNDPNIK